MKRVRILVVDDHALFRAGLISLLGEMSELQVVGEAGSGEAAIKLAATLKPDVILLDVNMPSMGGVEAVRAIKPREACRIIMLTISKNDADLFGAISAGADGYLLKNAEPEELRRAILQVSEGMSVLSPQITRQVMQAVNSEMSRSPDFNLSSREMDVLGCLAQGQTTLQIADSLYISENTVKTHVRHILEKLEASNRAEAVSKAVQMGLIGTE
jgi:DNA-binding NarL/FixJ family response regulator